MDLIDKKILCELDFDCRAPLSKIAKKLKLGRNVVAYRIKNLNERGIISRYICSLNLGALGYKTYKIHFKIHNGKKAESEFVKCLLQDKSVIHCMKTEGAFDYSATVAASTILELDKFLMALKNNFSEIINDYSVSIVIYSKIFKANKLFLGEKQYLPKIEKYCGEAKIISLDDKDIAILKVLSQSADISIIELSKRVGFSVDVIKYRLKQLNRTVINSNRAIFDLNRIGYYHYVIMLKIRKATDCDEEKLVSWCSTMNNVLYCTKRIGTFDFTINAAITDINDFNLLLFELKNEFGEIIDSYETVLNSQMLKLNYVPF